MLGTRFVGDFNFGDTPLYLMTRQEGLVSDGATGGATSIRGIKGQRYTGKVKLLGNVELRSLFFPFEVFGESFILGALAFIDAGRVWADWERNTHLDSGSALYKVGIGGGLRLFWGETFALRADVAHSPTEGSLGYYIDVSHIF